MKIVNSKQLAWLLDIETQEAIGKIIFCHNKEVESSGKGRMFSTDKSKVNGKLIEKNVSTDVENIKKHSGIDLLPAIEDIEKNYFKRPVTKGWIIQYPQGVLSKAKGKGTLPKSVGIPDPLKTFLSEEVRSAIIEVWNFQYEWYVRAGGYFKSF